MPQDFKEASVVYGYCGPNPRSLYKWEVKSVVASSVISALGMHSLKPTEFILEIQLAAVQVLSYSLNVLPIFSCCFFLMRTSPY